MGFTKTQKSRHLENITLFSLQIKKNINYTSRPTLWQKKTFAVVAVFKLIIFSLYLKEELGFSISFSNHIHLPNKA